MLALCFAIYDVGPTFAAEKVDVELVLAVDGSGSIDDIEFALQRKGYARAISHPLVLNAIRGGEFQKIAVLFVEWGAPESVETIVDWTVVRDADSAKVFADKLIAAPRQVFGYNSISAAIAYSTKQLLSNAYDGRQKIIDISGDGPADQRPAAGGGASGGAQGRDHHQRPGDQDSHRHQLPQRVRRAAGGPLPTGCDRRPGRLRHVGGRGDAVRGGHPLQAGPGDRDAGETLDNPLV